MKSLKKVGIVGISGYGRTLLDELRRLHDSNALCLAGAVVINADDEVVFCVELKALGLVIWSSFEEMLADLTVKLDLLLIPTGIHWHSEMSIAAMQAGMHVLVEKPAAATIGDVRRMFSVAESTERKLIVCFQDIAAPATHALLNVLKEGRIGALREIRVLGSWPRPKWYFQRNEWAGRLKFGDRWVLDCPFNNALAHFLNLALFWGCLGHPAQNSLRRVKAELYRANNIESCDTAGIRATLHSGIKLSALLTHACAIRHDPEIHLLGEAGTICWKFEDCFTVRTHASGESVCYPVEDAYESRRAMLEAALSYISEPASPLPQSLVGIASLVHTQLVNAAFDRNRIHCIPDEDIQENTDASGYPLVYVPELEPCIASFLETGYFPSDLAYGWAVWNSPAIEIDALQDEPRIATETPIFPEVMH
ncbi:Gfo/Idh/MocA family protein [Coraliomargarita sp. W4R53]